MTHLLPRHRRQLLAVFVLTAAALHGLTPAHAANPPDSDQLVRQLEQTLADATKQRNALRSGAERVSFCAYCHGKDGNSVKPDVPKLAGQNAKYLFNQFENFAAGRRQNFVMQKLAPILTAQDRINIAIYYESLPVRPERVDPALASNGKVIYDSVCAICHGSTGLGQDQYPRLAGQKPDYVARTLRTFRSNDSKHTDPTMRQIAKTLTEDNIDSISAYVAGLH